MVGRTDADDVVQEALTRAWKKRDSYRPDRGTPRIWLLALTADQARRLKRRAARGQSLACGAEFANPAADTYADVDLRRAVAQLSKRQRETVAYFYYADLSVEATARIMHCSTGTVKSTLSDARKILAARLEVHSARD